MEYVHKNIETGKYFSNQYIDAWRITDSNIERASIVSLTNDDIKKYNLELKRHKSQYMLVPYYKEIRKYKLQKLNEDNI